MILYFKKKNTRCCQVGSCYKDKMFLGLFLLLKDVNAQTSVKNFLTWGYVSLGYSARDLLNVKKLHENLQLSRVRNR